MFYQVDFNKARPKLLYITESKFDHEWNSTLHTHLYTEIFYVTKGHALLSLDNKNYPVKEDYLVIVNPLVSHTERGIEKCQLRIYCYGNSKASPSFQKKKTKNKDVVLPTIMIQTRSIILSKNHSYGS